MIKSLLICVLLTFNAMTIAQAEGRSAALSNSTEVVEVRKVKSTLFSPVQIASGTFQQEKYFKILKHPIKSSGSVFFEKNLGFIWQTLLPVKSALMLKGEQFYSKEEGAEPVRMNHSSALSSVLLSALSGDLAQLEQEFTVERSPDCLSLRAKSKSLSKVIESILLCGQEHVERIVLSEVSGNSTVITLQLAELEKLPEEMRAQLQ